MKLVVGLGNPGERYAHTRHNLGFLTVESLAAVFGSDGWQEKRSDPPYAVAPLGKHGGDISLALKPGTFMNESGSAVTAYVKNAALEPSDIWVVHDDVDLPIGELREAFDSGSAGHKGVESIIETIGTKAFHRLRIGVGRPENPDLPTDAFVLEKMDPKLLTPLVDSAVSFLRATISPSP